MYGFLKWAQFLKTMTWSDKTMSLFDKTTTLIVKTMSLFYLLELLVMIRLALDDGTGTVELFCKDQSYHLMGEREF